MELNRTMAPSIGEGQTGGPLESRITTRGLGASPHALIGKHHAAHEDKPWQFKSITVEKDKTVIDEALKMNGFVMKVINLGDGLPGQVLIYRQEDIEAAKEYVPGSRTRMIKPHGVAVVEGKAVAVPVVWSDSDTETVKLRLLKEEGAPKGAIAIETTDRIDKGIKKETLILYKSGGQSNIYTEKAWKKAYQISSLVQEGLGLPAGSLGFSAEKPEPDPITWNDDEGYGEFDSSGSGLYAKPRPGMRYAFMGWVRPKKVN